MSLRKLRLLIGAVATVAVLAALVAPASASVAATPADGTAQVDGTVYALARLGDRTIIGGEFTEVDGLPRLNVAALLPDGSVDPDFVVDTDGVVRALTADLALDQVYLGGSFTTVNGVERRSLAAVDGAVAAWTADTDGIVYGLDTHGGRVYAGGTFRQIGGLTIRRLAAVDGATGAVEIWTDTGQVTDFAPQTGGTALAAAVSPDGTRFMFATTDNVLHVYRPALSDTPAYQVKTGGDTQAIGVSDDTIYIGGHFTRIHNDRSRRVHMAALDLADGSTTGWDPGVNGRMGVWAVLVSADTVHIGGDFDRVNRERRSGYAAFVGAP
jgi:hypothetical protein